MNDDQNNIIVEKPQEEQPKEPDCLYCKRGPKRTDEEEHQSVWVTSLTVYVCLVLMMILMNVPDLYRVLFGSDQHIFSEQESPFIKILLGCTAGFLAVYVVVIPIWMALRGIYEWAHGKDWKIKFVIFMAFAVAAAVLIFFKYNS